MNRKTFLSLIVALILFVFLAVSSEPAWSGTSRRVDAPSGLRMRESPQLNAKVVATLQNGLQVELIEEKDPEIAIDGKKGKWTKVHYDAWTGWVFGGFLVDEDEELTLNKIIGGTFNFSIDEIDGADSTSFQILPDGRFTAECLLHGSGDAKIEGTYRAVVKKDANAIHFFIKGNAQGRHVADTEKRWAKKFTNGEVTITKKNGVYRGTFKCPICDSIVDKKLNADVGK